MVEYIQTRTGPGTVTFENIETGIYNCEVSSPGYETESFPVEVIEDITQSYSITMEEVEEVAFNPSQVQILVHAYAPEDSELIANPPEIGTETNPELEGTLVNIVATLRKKVDLTPIEGKTLHFHDTDGTEVGSGVTDVNGQVTFPYSVLASDDGKYLTIKYLGD